MQLLMLLLLIVIVMLLFTLAFVQRLGPWDAGGLVEEHAPARPARLVEGPRQDR